MFNSNPNFYPTPESLLKELFKCEKVGNDNWNVPDTLDIPTGRILEPSAGKGTIIKFIQNNQPRHAKKTSIDAIENDLDLKNLLFGAGHTVVWDDFITYKTHKEYDSIVMNPPFDEGAKHVLKAINLAEHQIMKDCKIYAIINAQTIKNPFSKERQLLINSLEKHGATIEFKEHTFSGSDSDRKTDVEVALIRLQVKVKASGKDLYDRFISTASTLHKDDTATLERSLSVEYTNNELTDRLHDIERYVKEYETAVRIVTETYQASAKEAEFMKYLANVNGDKGRSLTYVSKVDKYNLEDQFEQTISQLRSNYWELILNTNEIRDLLTGGGRDKLQKKLEMSKELEINLVNIEMLIMSLQANSQDILIESCVSVFEQITKYHMNDYSKNIHYYNGWKTNGAFKMNTKVIYPVYDSFLLGYDGKGHTEYEKVSYVVKDLMRDIIRMIKLFDPTAEDTFSCRATNDFENDWIRFKIFKKGTIHIWFKDKDILDQLNFICGQHFNWLPTDDEMQTEEAKEFVKNEFGAIVNPKQLLTA